MSTELLLREFERLSEVPDAIPRLRRFVLDLAVRGKLTPQDSTDEPASELLRRIDAERHSAGRSRPSRNLRTTVGEDELPFALPQGWEWTRVRRITSDRGQKIPDQPFTYIDVTAIDKRAGRVSEPKILDASGAPSRARKLVRKGDVIYSCVRPYLLNVAVIEAEYQPEPIVSTAFAVMNAFGLVAPRYLWIALRSPFMVESVEAKMRGQAYPAINDVDFGALPFPLPPLKEQHRTVAKVTELMALCDRMEEAQAERERRRGLVATTSLQRVDQAIDAHALRPARDFHLGNLTRLVKRPGDLAGIRSTIRNLAVRGHLVPYKKDEGWEATTFGGVCDLVTSGSRGWGEYYADHGAKFIRAQNIRFGRLRLDDVALVNPPAGSGQSRTLVAKNDLFIVITGAGVTNPAMLEEDLGEAYVSQHVALIKPALPEMSRWLLLWLMARAGARDHLLERAYGAGKPGLNLENIRSLPLYVPSLEEQRAILAELDRLMEVCDRLESALAVADRENSRLLDAALHVAAATA